MTQKQICDFWHECIISSSTAVWSRVMELGTVQLSLNVIALLWWAAGTACGSVVVVAERMSKVMKRTWCQTRLLFPLEQQMAAHQLTLRGDAATRRSKQGGKTRKHINVPVYTVDTDTHACLSIMNTKGNRGFFIPLLLLYFGVSLSNYAAQWKRHYLQHLLRILCFPSKFKQPHCPRFYFREQTLSSFCLSA